MSTNVYFSHGAADEQYLVEDLIIESIKIYGQQLFYIPRSLVAKDNILGEDRLSEFKTAYPVEMYLQNVDGFEGQGAFIQKFGLMMEQSATLIVARRRWDQLVGRFGQTQLPNRPNEGDLLYFPLTKGLFEIKYVKYQDPFYQLGKLYVYTLQVELFQYASEHIDTGIKDIDVFETLRSYDTDFARNATGSVTSVTITVAGSGYTTVPVITVSGGSGQDLNSTAILTATLTGGIVTSLNIINVGTGYDTAPTITIGSSFASSTAVSVGTQVFWLTKLYTVTTAGTTHASTKPTHSSGAVTNGTAILTFAGLKATATASIEANPDLPQSYGDNIKFKAEAVDLLFDTNNPFGEVQ